MAVQTGPHDAQDGDDEQDGEGHVGADEGGEERGHDVEGGRGGLGQRGEEAGRRSRGPARSRSRCSTSDGR